MTYNGKEIKIEYTEFPDGVHRFCKGFVVEDKDDFLIGIDSRNAPIVQRYVLGHELAHIFLGHELPYISEYINMQKEHKAMEREANKQSWVYYRLYRDSLDRATELPR